MSALREEELNMINGGNVAKGMLGGAKFNGKCPIQWTERTNIAAIL